MKEALKTIKKFTNTKFELFNHLLDSFNIKINKDIKASKFSLYMVLINNHLLEIKDMNIDYQLYNDIKAFVDKLVLVTHHMLEGRFNPSKPLNSKKKTKRSKSPISGITSDMAAFLYEGSERNTSIDKITKEFNPLDVISVYKLFENFTLKRVFIVENLEEYKLGKVYSELKDIFDSLPKLLLGVDNVVDNELRTKILNLLFSSIIIYRQFKVKTKPAHNTISDIYNGENLDTIKENEFSQNSIKE